jgi:hypothetical protein
VNWRGGGGVRDSQGKSAWVRASNGVGERHDWGMQTERGDVCYIDNVPARLFEWVLMKKIDCSGYH